MQPTQKVLFSATLSNKIYCCAFWSKILLFVYLPSTTADCNSFNNHRNKKVVEGNYNVLVYYADASAPVLSNVVLWNPFKWDILWFILIKNLVACVSTTLAKRIYSSTIWTKKCRRQTQCSSTLFGFMCTWPIWCCPLQPFQMRYFVVCTHTF